MPLVKKLIKHGQFYSKMDNQTAQFQISDVLEELNIKAVNLGTSTGANWFSSGGIIKSISPVDGQLIATVKTTSSEDYEKVLDSATDAFKSWRQMPAPQRGEIVRQFGDKLRE